MKNIITSLDECKTNYDYACYFERQRDGAITEIIRLENELECAEKRYAHFEKQLDYYSNLDKMGD
jgi:hypothetical protein